MNVVAGLIAAVALTFGMWVICSLTKNWSERLLLIILFFAIVSVGAGGR